MGIRCNRTKQIGVVALGLIATQAVLIGPSLIGRKVLLPLDILAQPGWLIHRDDVPADLPPPDMSRSDQVLQLELFRRFAVQEVRAGRLPLWNPYNYAGYPFVAVNQTAVFSPLRVLDYLWPGPQVIAWGRLLRMLIAGLGVYFLFRGMLKVRFWPAAIGAWAYPMTGIPIFWASFPLCDVAIWLPWLLLAIERTVRRPRSAWPLVFALLTATTMLSGHAAMAGQIFIGAAMFFVWRLTTVRGLLVQRVAAVGGGWLLGMALAMPQSLPTYDYIKDSSRVVDRSLGRSDFQPQGLAALPKLMVPHSQTRAPQGARLIPMEHLPAAYVGLSTLLLAAPLGFVYRRRRAAQWFFLAWSIIGLGYLLNIAPVVWLMKLPPLNLLQANRFTVLAGLGLLAMAVLGLDALARRHLRWRNRFWLPTAMVVIIGLWCAMRAVEIESLRTQAQQRLEGGSPSQRHLINQTMAEVIRVHWVGFGFAAAALAGWLLLRSGRLRIGTIAALIFVELLLFSWNALPQTDPSLYYPPRPLLADLSGKPGRVVGIQCMPPNLSQVHQLRDIRGYDAVDPSRYVQLLNLTADPSYGPPMPYAYFMRFVPRLSPITKLLGLQHVILPGPPPPGSDIVSSDSEWTAVRLDDAMPRVFVPTTTAYISESQQRLQFLGSPHFDPARIAVVESPVETANAMGRATITRDDPTHIEIDLDMKTPGLVVLTDRWDTGWHATIDDKPTPVLRVNHALRGVMAPAGTHRLAYRYWPRSFMLGLQIMTAAITVLAIWLCAVMRYSRQTIENANT